MDRLVVISFLSEGLQPYYPIWDLQKRLWKERVEGQREDTLVLVEHQKVITLGRGFHRENLLTSPTFLQKMGFEVVHVERGGDVTYHGPGQLVAYPIFEIREKLAGVRTFVHNLEEVMIRMASHFGVQAHRDPDHRGVFVGKNKLGAVGVTVRRWVSFHGFAFYVCVDPNDFRWIIPCGLQEYGITSLALQTGREIRVQDTQNLAIQAFQDVFGYTEVLVQQPEEIHARGGGGVEYSGSP